MIPARPSQLPIAITMGDPAGIGPEIIAKAFREDPAVTAGCFVVGDMATLRRASAVVSGPGRPLIPVAGIDAPQEAYATPPRCIPVLQTPQRLGPVAVGRVSAEAGQAAADCVVWAAQAALRKEIGAIVTAPLHKEALAAAGISYPGHTELLQAQAAAFLGKTVSDVPVRMMLANDELRTVLLSIHVALRDAIDAVGARCDGRVRQPGGQLVGPAPVRGGEGPVGLGVDQPGAEPTTGTGPATARPTGPPPMTSTSSRGVDVAESAMRRR